MMKKFSFSIPFLAAAAISTASVSAAPLPQSAELHYTGNYGIPAVMTFTRNGSRYKVVSNIKVPLYSIRFESGGTVSGSRLIPSYYQDVRGGKPYAGAKFGGGKISYGKAGQQQTRAASGTTMDLFTLAWQLAVSDGRLPPGLNVTNGKKIYPVSGLTRTGSGSYKIAGSSTPVNKYRLRRGDSTVNYAFAPELGNIPVQISYTDEGKTYDLKLTKAKINGRAVHKK